MMNLSNEKSILVAIILSAFIVSLAYSFYFQIPPLVDTKAYDNIAWNLVQGNGYRESAELSFEEDIAIMRVGPGYEFFLAGIYYLFGRNHQVVWVIHAILGALSALLIYLTTKEIFRRNWSIFLGIVPAILIGLSPDLITMSGMLMTETLGVFLIILTTYLFFRYVNNESKPLYLAVLVALVFGSAVLVRTPAALLFLPFSGYLIINKNWKQLFVFIGVLFLVFLPWTIRNYQVYRAFIPTNYAFGYDLLVGNHPGATGELEPYESTEELIQDYGRVEGNKLAVRDALSFIFTNPLEFLKITFYRLSIYFSFARPTGFWFHLDGMSKALTLILSAIYSVILFGLGFLGVYKIKTLLPEDKNRVKLFLWMLLMMPLAVIGIIIETRYRFLVYPFFAVFAGFGLVDLLRSKANIKAFFVVFGILFLNTTFDVLRNLERIIDRLGEIL